MGCAVSRDTTYSGLILRDERVYSVEKVWKKVESAKVYNINIQKLKNNLENEYWIDGNKVPITPNMVLSNKNNPVYREHWSKINQPDFDYPIVLLKITDNKYDIIDGLHRYCSAIVFHMEKIQCKIISKKNFDACYIGSEVDYWNS